MMTRQVEAFVPPREVILQTPPNRAAMAFFGGLAAVHLAIASPALLQGRWEGFLGLAFAGAFLIVMVGCYWTRREMIIAPRERRIKLSKGIGRLRLSREVAFSDVRAIQLIINQKRRRTNSRIEVICDNQIIHCPPTTIPRQQALFFAVLMRVRLIKVIDASSSEAPPPLRDRML